MSPELLKIPRSVGGNKDYGEESTINKGCKKDCSSRLAERDEGDAESSRF